MCVWTQMPPTPPTSSERKDEVVVSRIEIEAAATTWRAALEDGFACLTARTLGISARRAIVAGSASTTTRLGMS